MSAQLLLPLVGYVIKHHFVDIWSYYGGGDDVSMKGMSGTQVSAPRGGGYPRGGHTAREGGGH
jgi:hypothetical protein